MATYAGKLNVGGTDIPIGSTLYGTCSTGASTAQKEVTCSNFDKLITGVTIHVKFTYSNTNSSPSLKVNSTTAKSIMRYGTTKPGTSTKTSWQAGSVVSFTYDGTYWQMNDWLNDDTTYTAATATPLMDGTGAVGSSTKYALEDHVHPSDTSRVPTSRTINSKALSADITLSASDVSAVATSAVGAASGVASLDSNGLVPNSQLPCDVVNTVTLATADWTLDSTSGYYVQTETVSGMTANSHPDAKIKYPSGTTELTKEIIDEAANLLVEMVTAANSVSFYAVSAPTSALTIYLKGV